MVFSRYNLKTNKDCPLNKLHFYVNLNNIFFTFCKIVYLAYYIKLCTHLPYHLNEHQRRNVYLTVWVWYGPLKIDTILSSYQCNNLFQIDYANNAITKAVITYNLLDKGRTFYMKVLMIFGIHMNVIVYVDRCN